MAVKLPWMGSETTDEDLMLRYRNGDVFAFEQLYARHKGGLYRYFLRKCHNESIAEELYQDVWMKLINSRDRYEVTARFTTWLYQLATNHFIDYYRKNRKSGAACQEDCDELENIPAPQNQQPEQQLQLSRQTSTLLLLIKELPDEQREVFFLKEEAGMNLSEIAEITGVNIETAKSRLRYAVNKLRRGLDAHG